MKEYYRNNYEVLLPYFKNIPEFHVIRIIVIQRKKDIEDLGKSENLIKDYYIRSKEHLDSKWKEIVTLADAFKARVYVNISPISLKESALALSDKITDTFRQNQWTRLPHAFRAVTSSEKGILKRFIIDFDSDNKEMFNEVKSLIRYYFKEVIETEVRTKSGWHLICFPFDRIKFNKVITKPFYEDDNIVVDALYNQPTLLYYNG